MNIDSIETTLTQLKNRAARAKVHQIWLYCALFSCITHKVEAT